MQLYEELSNKIVGAFFSVHNAALNVFYKGKQVGEFYTDLAVNNKVIIEIKSVRSLSSMHEAQLFNYMPIATRLLVESNSWQGVVSKCRVGYLVNFQGTRVVFKRFVL